MALSNIAKKWIGEELARLNKQKRELNNKLKALGVEAKTVRADIAKLNVSIKKLTDDLNL